LIVKAFCHLLFSVLKLELHNFGGIGARALQKLGAVPFPTDPAPALIFIQKNCQIRSCFLRKINALMLLSVNKCQNLTI
jgi:hypothetical protein